MCGLVRRRGSSSHGINSLAGRAQSASTILVRLAHNSRFLILPWVRVPPLASHILGNVVGRLASDWQAHFGHRVVLLESFVPRDRFRGSCYRAANWFCVGQTQGRTRQDRERRIPAPVKDILVYPLQANFRRQLCLPVRGTQTGPVHA